MIKETENGLIVNIKISPNSKSNAIIKNENEQLKQEVTIKLIELNDKKEQKIGMACPPGPRSVRC